MEGGSLFASRLIPKQSDVVTFMTVATLYPEKRQEFPPAQAPHLHEKKVGQGSLDFPFKSYNLQVVSIETVTTASSKRGNDLETPCIHLP